MKQKDQNETMNLYNVHTGRTVQLPKADAEARLRYNHYDQGGSWIPEGELSERTPKKQIPNMIPPVGESSSGKRGRKSKEDKGIEIDDNKSQVETNSAPQVEE